MNVVGLITEYNPFHNGHLHHLRKAKELAQADYTIVVMSGNFVQRGEPALFNKWTRTAMALAAGADLIIEIPTAYATRNAQFFAWGAVGLLNATGLVSHLCFGSESGNIAALQELALFLTEEPSVYKEHIHHYLAQGIILPRARHLALIDYLQNYSSNKACLEWLDIIASPNNILGLEYLAALSVWKSNIQPLTTQRIHTGYHDSLLDYQNNIASATAIREFLTKNNNIIQKDLQLVLPSTSLELMNADITTGRGPVFAKDMSQILLAKLRSSPMELLANTVDLTEGLENRIKELSFTATDWKELVDAVKTKRYTRTRIQRLLYHFLIGYNQTTAHRFDGYGGPQYIRILGFTTKGRQLLKQMKKQATLPIITHVGPAFHQPNLSAIGKEMLSMDILSTDLYTLFYPDSEQRIGGPDWRTAPVQVLYTE